MFTNDGRWTASSGQIKKKEKEKDWNERQSMRTG